jgi:hypothetical protein
MRFYSPFIILFALQLNSCSKNEYLPDLEGDIVGYAYSFNEFEELFPDNSGIKVFTQGDKIYRAVTDRNGRYEFRNVPIGTYTLIFEKPGFGTVKYYGVRHLGGTPTIVGKTSDGYYIYGAFIYQKPVTRIIDLKIVNDSLYAKFNLNEKKPSHMRLIISISDKPGFSDEAALHVLSRTLFPVNEWYGCPLQQNSLNLLESGSKYYYRAGIYSYSSGLTIGSMSVYGISNYFDHTLNNTVYPNLGETSQEYTFIKQ